MQFFYLCQLLLRLLQHPVFLLGPLGMVQSLHHRPAHRVVLGTKSGGTVRQALLAPLLEMLPVLHLTLLLVPAVLRPATGLQLLELLVAPMQTVLEVGDGGRSVIIHLLDLRFLVLLGSGHSVLVPNGLLHFQLLRALEDTVPDTVLCGLQQLAIREVIITGHWGLTQGCARREGGTATLGVVLQWGTGK